MDYGLRGMDIIAFVAGLIVGIVAVSIAVEFAWKKTAPEKTCKLIKNWHLDEIRNALIVAEKLQVEPPHDAKVVVGTPSSFAQKAHENPEIVGNFAVGVNKAFIFAGDIKNGQVALATSDEELLQELREIFFEYDRAHEERKSYTHHPGAIVIRGVVRAVFPYRDGYLMRISYEGGLIGAFIKERMDVEGRHVEVEGQILDPPFMSPTNITVLD